MKQSKRFKRLQARRAAWRVTMDHVKGSKWAYGFKEPGSLKKGG